MRKGLQDPIVRAYYNYMVKIAVAFGAERERATKEMEEVINLDIALAKVLFNLFVKKMNQKL